MDPANACSSSALNKDRIRWFLFFCLFCLRSLQFGEYIGKEAEWILTDGLRGYCTCSAVIMIMGWTKVAGNEDEEK